MYEDEHQQVQVSAGLLTAVFFSCRPCSLFDTQVKLDNDSGEPADNLLVANGQNNRNHSLNTIKMGKGNDMKCRHICNTVMAVNSDCKINSDASTACNSDNDTDPSSVYNTDNNCNTDDDCDAGPEKT